MRKAKAFDYEPFIIPLDGADTNEDKSIFYDEDLGEIKIIGEIGNKAYNDFRDIFQTEVMSQLALAEPYRQPVRIYISSPGGDVLQGLNIINEIQAAQSKGIEIVCTAGDTVASMALAIYMIGDTRICNQFSEFMFHQIRGGGSSAEVREQEVIMERTKLYWETLKALTKAYTDVSDKWIDTVYKEKIDHYFFGQEAVELGFADLINE